MKQLLIILLLIFPGFVAAQSDSAGGLAWPPAPERARIRYIATISPRESGSSEKGLLGRIISWFSGDETNSGGFVQPVGIAVSPGGIIAVADPGANGIHLMDGNGQNYRFLSRTDHGAFKSPVGVAFSPDGSLFISDSQRGEIVVLDEKWKLVRVISEGCRRPTGLRFAGGTLLVADAGVHQILTYSPEGTLLSRLGRRGSDDGEFNFPVSVTVAESLIVVDALNYRIQCADRGGKHWFHFGRQGSVPGCFANPKSVAVDGDGNIYVSDVLMDNIQIFDGAGRLLLVFGRSGSRPGEFSSPSGLTFDDRNRLYVVDTMNKRIQIFQYLR